MQVDDVDRSVGAQPREHLARVAVHDASATAEAGLLEAFVDDRGPLQPNLDAEEARLGSAGGALEHETAASRANLDLERPRAGQDRPELDLGLVGQPGSVRVGVIGPRAEGHRGGTIITPQGTAHPDRRGAIAAA